MHHKEPVVRPVRVGCQVFIFFLLLGFPRKWVTLSEQSRGLVVGMRKGRIFARKELANNELFVCFVVFVVNESLSFQAVID